MQFSKKYRTTDGKTVEVRKGDIPDSIGIINVWNSVVRERSFTMGLNFFDVREEQEFIKSLDKREALLVAVLDGKIVGYSLVLIPDKKCMSTLHVAEIGTWVIKEYRGLGIGRFLLDSVFSFTRNNEFEKIVIKVRSTNNGALNFYEKNGFTEAGRFRNQIKIDGKYEDHVLMEIFLK